MCHSFIHSHVVHPIHPLPIASLFFAASIRCSWPVVQDGKFLLTAQMINCVFMIAKAHTVPMSSLALQKVHAFPKGQLLA